MQSDLISQLNLFALENPFFSQEIRILINDLEFTKNSEKEKILKLFFRTHKSLCAPLKLFLSKNHNTTRFLVFNKNSEVIQAKFQQARGDEHLKSWISTVNSIPTYTNPLSDINKDFLANAKKSWDEFVCGNEDVLKILLRHVVEYCKTGQTTPILLNGPPGIGKTLISKVYASMLQLPYYFISGPSASMRRGLSGDPALYTNAGPGAIVQAMITTKSGNPSICIDELDKALGGHSGRPNFQYELLSALDESNTAFFDNYLETELDASHIPYIFTSNDKNFISRPLLDRMEIIEMKPPEKDTMLNIMQKHTLPNVLKVYDCSDIFLEENSLEILVDELWSGGNRSCRPYKKAINQLISDAYLTSLDNKQPITISAKDVQNTAKQFTQQLSKPIGFRTE